MGDETEITNMSTDHQLASESLDELEDVIDTLSLVTACLGAILQGQEQGQPLSTEAIRKWIEPIGPKVSKY